MQITTLGPLAVDGRPIRGERLTAVVRELVEARGRAVSTAVLVEAVWDGAPPEDAPGAVQALVSRVRRLGLPVIAGSGGYRVPADQVDVDAVQARLLVERARAALRTGEPATARRCADEARALFPEVPELAGGDGVRLLADVAALRAELAFAGEGRFDETDLRRLVAHTPPDEPSAALLVRVLAAQGRNAEALAVVESLRDELAERYGTDPSPVVAQAHLALLRGEFDPAPVSVAPQAPPRHAATAVLPAAWRRPGTALVGRDGDLATVTDALALAPLVTVVATGGAGKTRLAAEIARQALRAGRSVRVVELAGLRSPEEVLPAVLAAIGGPDTATARPDPAQEWRRPDPEDRLRVAAQDLDGLVVLDNCEHVLDAAATVVAGLLAAAAPDLAVLATSRAPLSLVGELVHRLPVLPDELAAELLAARVRAGGVTPGWDAERARQLCHRLDNLPLALELAAARLRHMPIDDVLAGLADRFALLDDALRGLPERHASLWAMVDWSHELLAPPARHLLRRVAIIPAPFTARAAALVAGAPEVRRELAVLVEQSLLSLVEDDGGPPRYRMQETVREYGVARLDAAGERAPAMAGLVEWAAGRAVELAADFIGPGQLVAFARCAAEQDNLSLALRWATAHDDEPAAVDIAAALFHLWSVRGLHVEVIEWAQNLLHTNDPAARSRSALIVGAASGRPLPDADRLAWLCLLMGLNGAVIGSHRVSVLARRTLRLLLAQRPAEISARAGGLATALPPLGLGDVEAGAVAAEALIAHPDPFVQGYGLLLRAFTKENRGLLAESIDDAVLGYQRFEAVGDHWGMGMVAQITGAWFRARGRDGADEWLRRGARHLELVGAAEDVDSIRVLLDTQLALSGDPEAARRLRDVAAGPVGRKQDVAQAHLGLAQLAWHQERLDDALRHAELMLQTAQRHENLPPPAAVNYQVVVAVLRLRVAAALPASGSRDDTEAGAVALLATVRDVVLSDDDVPAVGSWALGGSALAEFRGDAGRARELWAAGARLGGSVAYLFPPARDDERLTAVPGEGREPERSVAETTERIRVLMRELLG